MAKVAILDETGNIINVVAADDPSKVLVAAGQTAVSLVDGYWVGDKFDFNNQSFVKVIGADE